MPIKVWDPKHAKLIPVLELIQNNSARFILPNCSRNASITAMKASLSLLSLTARRNLCRLNFVHYGTIAFLTTHLFYHRNICPIAVIIRQKTGIPFCKCKTFSEYFLPRTTTEWNNLPSDMASTNRRQ